MTLGEQQRDFTRNVGLLITHAYSLGLELTLGDAYRSPEQASANEVAGTGIAKSLHTQRLAIDLNLFVNGVYQEASEAYAELGSYWKSLDPLNRWGGDFNDRNGNPKPDGNHFASTRGGVK